MPSFPESDFAKHGIITVKKHSSCWSLRHQSQFMCMRQARANIFCHADSCLLSLPEAKQWYLSCHPVIHTIMSVLWAYFISPLNIFIINGCWFFKLKIHANRLRRGLGHGIQAGKTIILLRALAHPSGPRCHRGCGIRCLASSVHKELWSSCQSNCLQSCSALSNIHHSLLLPARHGRNGIYFLFSVLIRFMMCCKW